MFIKRDHRKVEEILHDVNDTRKYLKLAKRSPEFQGTVRILCKESKLEALSNLRILNLYDNALTTVQGMGILSQTPIEEINLGCNNLMSIPLEFGALKGLKRLWLDDNKLFDFPICLCQLVGLEALRLSGNELQTIPSSISNLQELHTISLDNNMLSEFPRGILSLGKLQHLWLRQNQIPVLPDDLDKLILLETLSISSNQLDTLPDCLTTMDSIKQIHANGNHISIVPMDLYRLPQLTELNLANNQISEIPVTWQYIWGNVVDNKTGRLEKSEDSMSSSDASSHTIVTMVGNPLNTTAITTTTASSSSAE